jgi:hypothetical protein
VVAKSRQRAIARVPGGLENACEDRCMNPARQQANVLAELLRRERDALAEFLSALADFDRRGDWVELGHGSLFAFLVKDLGLSNGAAAYRKAAVELVQRFPQVLEPVRDGRLCISTVFELSKVITEENAAEVLPRFFGTSKRDAKNVVAELAPTPAPERTVITAVAAPSLEPRADLHDRSGRLADQVNANSSPAPQLGHVPQQAPRTVVEPKTAELSRVHVTVPRRLLEKLKTATDALSHSHPNASDAEVLEVGLDLIIARYLKRRGIGAKPRKTAAPSVAPTPVPETTDAPPPAPKRSRHVPAAVWRGVWERDGGCCAWPLEGGGVCGSTDRLELDHLEGWALGAETTIEKTRLLCNFHQDVSARQLYGDDVMNTYTRPKTPRCSEPIAPYGAGGVPPSSPAGGFGAVAGSGARAGSGALPTSGGFPAGTGLPAAATTRTVDASPSARPSPRGSAPTISTTSPRRSDSKRRFPSLTCFSWSDSPSRPSGPHPMYRSLPFDGSGSETIRKTRPGGGSAQGSPFGASTR